MRRLSLFFGALLCVLAAHKNVWGQGSQTVNSGTVTAPVNFPTAGCLYTWVNDAPGIGLPASGQGSIPAFTAMNTGGSPVTATITATLVTPAAYIGNEADSTITVINIANQQIITTIKLIGPPNNIAVSPDGSKVYVTMGTYNQKAFGTVVIISTITNQVVGNISLTTTNPGGIVVSADGSKLYISDDSSNLITIVNTSTKQVSGTTTINSAAALCISPDGTTLYAANENDNYVNVINTTNMSVVTTIPVGKDPIAMAITPDGSKVYVSNYVSGSVSVINTISNKVEATLSTGYFSFYMSMSHDGSAVYVGSGNGSASFLSTISTATNSIVNTLHLNPQPYGMCITPDGSQIYINDSNNNYTTVVDTKSYTTLATIPTGLGPFSPGTFITGGVGCSNEPLKYTITVNPVKASALPQVTTGPLTGIITACAGNASASPNIQQFTISGSNLTAGVTATAPTGFEVSLSATTGYAGSVTVPETNGTAASTTVYVRSAAPATPGNLSGQVTLTSTGAASQSVPVTGTVNAPPTVNPVGSQTVINGTNTTAINFTGAASGFSWVNDSPAIGLTATGAGNIAPFTAVNTGSTPIVATITVTPLPAEYAYIGNAHSNNVSVINTTTNQVVTTIPVGSEPQGVSVSPDNAHVYVVNSNDNTVSAISSATNTVIATIPVGQIPQAVSVSRDNSEVFVSNISSESVSVISTATNTVTATIPDFIQPFALAASPTANILFVANTTGAISVVNTSTNTIQQSVQVGSDPYQIVVSPDGSTVYVTNFLSNTVSVISTATYSVTHTYPVGSGPMGLAISPDGSLLYVVCDYAGAVMVVQASTGKILQTINVSSPVGISITADGKSVYVTCNPPSAPPNNIYTAAVINTATNVVTTTVPVGLNPISLGNFVAAGSGCNGAPITFTITVQPTIELAEITAGPVTGAISACAGTASASPNIAQFSVAAKNLTGDMTAAAPTGFEVSLAPGSGYAGSITIPETSGIVDNTIVYVASLATASSGTISGNVILSAPESTAVIVPVTATINALPTVNPVMSQTVNDGGITAAVDFTGTGSAYSWSNDSPAIGLAANGTGNIASFTAINKTITPVIATVTVTPFDNLLTAGTSCTGSPVSFTITVKPGQIGAIMIPNTFTPNGDGINDTWDIKQLSFFPQCSVKVFNRWGQNVYTSIGYGTPWNGTYSGSVLPTGTYYYVINLNNNTAPLAGFVAIVK